MKERDIEKVRGLLKRRNHLQGGLQALKRSAANDGCRSIMFDLPDHYWCEVSQERLKSFLQNEIDRIEDQLMSLGVELETPIEERKDTA